MKRLFVIFNLFIILSCSSNPKEDKNADLKLYNKAIDAMTKAALHALKEDRAEAITYDCTGLTEIVNDVKSNLLKEGFDVPVIEPVAASLKLAETLVDLGISHSKITYPIPPIKS